jgi:hypothetical protein
MHVDSTWIAVGLGVVAASFAALVIVVALTPASDYEEEADE